MRSKGYLTIVIMIVTFVISLFIFLFVRMIEEISNGFNLVLNENVSKVI